MLGQPAGLVEASLPELPGLRVRGAGREQIRIGVDGPDPNPPVDGDQRLSDEIVAEQPYRVQPAGIGQLRQCGGQCHAGGDPDRGLQRTGDDDRQTDLGRDPQTGADSAQRLDLEHGDVGSLLPGDQIGVGGASDGLVGSNRHVHSGSSQRDPHSSQLVDRATGLLGIFQAESAQSREGIPRLVHVPGTIGINPDPAVRAERLADRGDSIEIIGQSLTPLSDLDLGGPATSCCHQRGRLSGTDGRHGGVDLDLVAERSRPALLGGLVGGSQPGRDLDAPIVEERTPFGPTDAAPPDHPLPLGDSAESGAQTQRIGSQRMGRRHACEGTRGVHLPDNRAPPATVAAVMVSDGRASGRPLQLATGTAEVLASLRRSLSGAGRGAVELSGADLSGANVSRADLSRDELSIGSEAVVTAPLPAGGPERAQTRAMLRPELPVTEPDAAAIVATSGSTGRPRGVVLSRTALIASADATAARLGGHGSWVLALPAHYVAGLMVLVRAVVGDRPAYSVDGRLTGLPDLVANELAAADDPCYTALVPTQLSRALADPVLTRALTRFDAVLLGGAATDPALLGHASAAGIRVVTTYGMSETCGGCVYDGLPLDGVSVATDDQDRISIEGPVLFSGYRLDPSTTADVLVGGQLRTRDRGRFVDHRLTVLGRLDDIVISGGMNVDLAAVERAVRAWVAENARNGGLAARDLAAGAGQIATVDATAETDGTIGTGVASAEVAIVGVPHPEWGTEVVAVVETEQNLPFVQAAPPDPGSTAESKGRFSLAELRDGLSAELPHYALPRRLLIRTLPRTSGGKIDRRRLVADLARPENRLARPENR